MDFTNNSNLQDYLRKKEIEGAAKKASRKRIVEEQNKKRWLDYQQHLRNTLGGGYLNSSIGIVTDGLRMYYDPSILTSYSGSGTTISDLSGNALNGTMTNITYTKPYFTFNGSTSQISRADNALLEPGSGDWTLELWVRHNTIAGKTRTIVSKTDNGGLASNWSYGMRTNSAGATYFEIGNGTTSVTSPSFTATTGVWYHIVGVWSNINSNSITLYKDGTLVGSNSHSFTSVKNSSNPLYIGNYNGNEYAQQFDGDLGVFIIYNRALSSAEVLQNYDANRPKY